MNFLLCLFGNQINRSHKKKSVLVIVPRRKRDNKYPLITEVATPQQKSLYLSFLQNSVQGVEENQRGELKFVRKTVSIHLFDYPNLFSHLY